MLKLVLSAIVGFISTISAAPANHHHHSAKAYCSNSDLSYALSPIPPPVRGAGTPGNSSTWQLTMDDTPSGYKQTITGFGAAVTDATVESFNTLSKHSLEKLMKTLLTDEGADFSVMRHTIGGSDLTGDPIYTYDDTNGTADLSLSHFHLGRRGRDMAKLLAYMEEVNSDLEVLGSVWSPPGWMKINKVIDGTTINNNLNDGYLETSTENYSSQFAEYFVKYIKAYKALGAHVNAITIQNEPLNSNAAIPSMYVFDYESAMLIEDYVGPALAKAGLSTGIWAWDHNTDVPSYPQTVIDNAGTYVDTVAWHCYANPVNWDVLTTFHETNPDVLQYMTECWTPKTGNWYQAADFTIGPLMNWASGVMAWTLGANSTDGPYLSSGGCHECTGLVTIEDDGSVTYQTAYYMMAQFSKFMPRGAIVLNGTGSYQWYGPGGIQSVASLNPDGTRSVVIVNTYGNDVYVSLNTSSGEEWSGNILEKSVVTWILPEIEGRANGTEGPGYGLGNWTTGTGNWTREASKVRLA